MKLKHIIYSCSLLAIAAAGGIGCKKSTFDINKNPNNPTDSTITYNFILPAAQSTTANIIATDWSWLENWMGFWARSGTYAPNTQEETYNVTTSFQNQVWNDLYSNSYNYEIMRAKAKQAGASFYEGVARVMKAHNFALLVDMYGNVPYSQAFQGNGNPTPKYDNGLDIYKDLFRQIDTGITNIKAVVASKNIDYVANDLMFAGNTSKWEKFGNTLKLRMLVHLMNNGVQGNAATTVTGIDIPGEFAKISAAGFLQEGETAKINPGYTTSKPNPFYRSYVRNEGGTATGNSVYYKANEYAIGYYNYNGDPRIDRFYISPGGAHAGVKYGLPPITANSADKLSSIAGPGVVSGATADAWIITSFESLFLQAEAAQRGFLTTAGSAANLYKRAVTESFVYMGLSATAANNYLVGNAGYGDVDFAVNPLVAILSQKWFALNSFAPFEVYTDWRRTDVTYGIVSGYNPGPPISVAPQLAGNSNVKIPVRLFYPQTEYAYNTANVSSQNISNAVTNKVFWDLK